MSLTTWHTSRKFTWIISFNTPWGCSVVKNLSANAEEAGLIPEWGRSPGEGNGNPLQYFLPGKIHGQKSLASYSPCSQRMEHNFSQHKENIGENNLPEFPRLVSGRISMIQIWSKSLCNSTSNQLFSFILLLKLSINQINTFDSCFDIIYSLYRNLYFWPHKKTQFSPCNTELKTKDLPLKWVFDNFVLGLIHLQMGLLPECCTNPFLVSVQTPSSLEQEEVLFRSAEYKYWRQFITVCVYLGNN